MLRIIEAGDQVDERGLARAGRPHEGDALPGLHRKRNVPERGRALIAVVQAHVAEGQLAERLVQRQRAAAFGLEGGIVEDGEYALGPGKGVLHVHIRTVQALERRIQHGKRAHEGKERARRHIALDDLAAAVPDDQPDAEGADEFHHRGRQLGHAGLAEIDVDDPGVFLVEAPRFLLFGGEGLDDPDAAEQLLQHAGDAGVHLGVLAPVPPQGPAEQRQREPGDGQDDDGPARQLEILLEYDVQQADHGDHLPDDLDERGQALPDPAHVVDDARHERPHLRLLIEVQGQGNDFLEQFLPHGFQHMQRAVVHAPVLQVAPGALQGRQHDEGQRHVQKRLAVLPDEDVVERGLDQPCRACRSCGNDAGSQQRDDHSPLVREEVPEHPQSQPEFFPAALGAFLLGLFLFTHSHIP